jgi:Fibronectin type III domain
MFTIKSSARFTGLAALLILATALTACDDSDSPAASSAASTTSGTTSPAATTDSATLSWAAPTENTNGTSVTNLAGYHIYYGTDASDLSQSVEVAGAQTTSFTITGLSPGTYYFAVNAYNNLGMDSDMSNVESTTI